MSKAENLPRPPKELGPTGRRTWREVAQSDAYDLTDVAIRSLVVTWCKCEEDLMRMRQTMAEPKEGKAEPKEGEEGKLLISDRFGQKQPNPLLAAIRGTETIKRQAIAALQLMTREGREAGRSAGRRSGSGNNRYYDRYAQTALQEKWTSEGNTLDS